MSKVVLGILTGILIFIASGILATYWVGKMRRDMEQKKPRLAHLATDPWSGNKKCSVIQDSRRCALLCSLPSDTPPTARASSWVFYCTETAARSSRVSATTFPPLSELLYLK